jgi:hypothetical protein
LPKEGIEDIDAAWGYPSQVYGSSHTILNFHLARQNRARGGTPTRNVVQNVREAIIGADVCISWPAQLPPTTTRPCHCASATASEEGARRVATDAVAEQTPIKLSPPHSPNGQVCREGRRPRVHHAPPRAPTLPQFNLNVHGCGTYQLVRTQAVPHHGRGPEPMISDPTEILLYGLDMCVILNKMATNEL